MGTIIICIYIHQKLFYHSPYLGYSHIKELWGICLEIDNNINHLEIIFICFYQKEKG